MARGLSRRALVKRGCAALGAAAFACPHFCRTAPAEVGPASAVLQGRIRIPPALLSTGIARDAKGGNPEYQFGGDVRIADLNGDRCADFVLAKSLGGMKICYIGAFTWGGRVLWEWGDKSRRVDSGDADAKEYRATVPARPGPLLAVDIDGDGRTEVVAMVIQEGIRKTSIWDTKDMQLVILDGASGKAKRTGAPESLLNADARIANGRIEVSNYVHQRLLAADFRGSGGSRDFVVKIGNTILACDGQLRPLWTYRNKFAEYPKHSAYIPAVGDMDGDGRDEVLGGNFALDHDGRPLWEKMMAPNNDSVAIVDWDGDLRNGLEGVLSGYGQVVRASGEVILKLGEKLAPHGQEVRCGRFRDDMPGAQMALRWNGHEPDILIAGREGEVSSRFKVDRSPLNVGMETVRWYGPDRPDLLCAPPALWDGWGRRVLVLPDMPKPSGRARDAWFHCIPADLEGDGRESVVLFDPCMDEMSVYGARPLKQTPPKGYRHTARQYNARIMD